MKTTPSITRPKSGYISYLLVIATGTILTILMVSAYRQATNSQSVQKQVQLRVDYSEKEEAILRAIVAITPNRAIGAMQKDSNLNQTKRDAMSWQTAFTNALDVSNSRTSISSQMVTSLAIPKLTIGNAGDSTLANPDRIFTAIGTETGYISPGINRSLGTGYPVPLTIASGDATLIANDKLYPIIAAKKTYGTLAQTGVGLPVATYPNFNLLKYPQINFGYAKPGDDFVAKRNWWSFAIDVGGQDSSTTLLARKKRNFVLSIYEIPSQLSISASSFMSLGQYASGDAWSNVSIDGGMFVGKAQVEGTTALTSLSSRRGMTLSNGTTIGGQSFTGSPFTPGVRETFQNQKDTANVVSLANQTTLGAFFPVSLASESGRSAFVPVNRGAAFFDRFDPVENDPIEATGALNHVASITSSTNTLSTTSWNNYSIGAQQCAMRVDVTGVVSSTNRNPTMLRFQYFLANGNRESMNMPLTTATQTSLPPGYVKVCDENQSFTFSSTVPVDIAYGIAGGFTFRQGITGTVAFNNTTFGDPKVGTLKAGYSRPRAPFEIKSLTSGQICVAIYPTRIPAFLTTIGAATTATNHSLSVNVDYSVTGLNDSNRKPYIPCTDNDYGLILKECNDLTGFTKGFSLVTNLRLYIGDDFNVIAATPPSGYTPAITTSNPTGLYYPPCSLFAPEKRYGVDVDAYGIALRGQIGSLVSDTVANPVRPLDSKNLSGSAISASRITVNLRPILHPAELPPITMMNWLVLLEERKSEYY